MKEIRLQSTAFMKPINSIGFKAAGVLISMCVNTLKALFV